MFFGFFFTFGLIIRDVTFLVKILAMHQGCRFEMGLSDELKEVKMERAMKMKIYNEVRQTVIELYIDLRK